MNPLLRRYGGLAVWLLAFAVVAVAIGRETQWGSQIIVQPPAVDATRAAPVSVALLPEYQIEGGAEARRETVDRPAFVPTRRPSPPPVPPAAAAPKMQRGQFMLTGTAVVDDKSIAFLKESAGGKARTVRTGETINGMTVAEVKADRVKLVMGSESEELTLKVAAGPRVTIQPAAPAPPGQPGAPGAPPVPGAPNQAAAAAAPPPDSDMSILERRRAARAQQAAAAEAARAQAAAQQGQPPQPGQAAQPSAPPAAPAAPITGARRGVPISQSLQPR